MKSTHDSRYENLLLMLLFFSIGFVFFDRLSINFLFPFMKDEFGLTNARIGMLTSVLAATWAVSGYLLSAYADGHQRRKPVLVAAVAVFSVCSIVSGLAGSFFMLLLARGLMGLAEGPVIPISQSLMAQASSAPRRGFNMGFIQASAAGLLGSVAAPAVIVPLAQAYGWRVTFYLAGLPGLLIALLLARCLRQQRNATEARSAAPAGVPQPQAGKLWSRNIALCTLLCGLYITWFLAIVTFSPMYMMEQRHMAPADMGWVMTVLGLSSVIAGFAVPALSDRIGRRATVVTFCLVAVSAPLVIAYFDGTMTQFCVAVFCSYLGYGAFPIFIATIPAESAGPANAARAIAFVNGVGEVVGGFVSPVLVGFAADHWGPQMPYWIAAGAAALAMLVAMGLRETAPGRSAAVPKERQDGRMPEVLR